MVDPRILVGHVLDMLGTLLDRSVQASATSPPYWGLRDYGLSPQDWPPVDFAPMPGLPVVSIPAQSVCLGLETDPWAFVGHLVLVFREVRRVLRDDGVLFLNLGDSYAGGGGYAANAQSNRPEAIKARGYHGSNKERTRKSGGLPVGTGIKHKDLCGIPWRVAFALQADGWYLRSDVIWEKPNPMPESCYDRPTRAHEYVFILSKSPHYFWDKEAVKEPDAGYASGNGFAGREGGSARVGPLSGGKGTEDRFKPGSGRNLRSVWTVSTQPYKGAHFATWPEALVERMIRASTRPGDIVLDPFGGSGTSGQVARSLGRDFRLIEANPDYATLAEARILTPTRAEKASGVTVVYAPDSPQASLFTPHLPAPSRPPEVP